MTDAATDTAFMRPGEFARSMFGENTKANRHVLYRMIDGGHLACVRIGERRDRWIPRSELSRLRAEAEANRTAAVAGV